jgi:hypothetical protein
LIGQEKERVGDESRRAKVHQQWLEQQDAQQVAHLMAGLTNGFRRKRAGDLLHEDVSTWLLQSLTAVTHITAVGSYLTHTHSARCPRKLQWLFVVHAICHTGLWKTTKSKRVLEDFLFDTDHSSLQLYRTVYKANHSVYQCCDYLSTVRCYPHRRLISRLRCGCHGLHVDTGRFGKGSEHCSREERVCPVCMSGSVEDEHHFLFDCPAYSHTRQQCNHLFHQASSLVATLLATDQSKVLGSDLKTSFAQEKSVLASPLLAWLLKFMELDECRASAVAVLAPSFITASLLQLLWCFIVERLEHLVLSVR